MERPSILDLLPSHRSLVADYQRRLIELMAVAVAQDIEPVTMAFIVADVRGHFGLFTIEADAGWEFLCLDSAGIPSMVIGLGVDGLVVLLAGIIPEALDPVLARPAGTTPVLVVDRDDEPAVVMIATSELTDGRPS